MGGAGHGAGGGLLVRNRDREVGAGKHRDSTGVDGGDLRDDLAHASSCRMLNPFRKADESSFLRNEVTPLFQILAE